MSVFETIDDILAMMQDAGANGMAARIAAIDGTVPNDFVYNAWEPANEVLRDTTKPNVDVRAGSWRPEVGAADPKRDGDMAIEVSFRYYGDETTVNVARVFGVVSRAMADLFRDLPAYSQARRANFTGVMQVYDPLDYIFGRMAGVQRGRVNGFSLIARLKERTLQ